MQLIILSGIQAAGKSALYQRLFSQSHIQRILDLLGTRAREKKMTERLIARREAFVVDNTNPTPAVRAKYIEAAKAVGLLEHRVSV